MQAPPGNILIVDDDPLNRRLLTKHLENDGHRTTQFDNGFAALAAIQAEPPDLVLLDVEMPGLDGIEVLERLKADAELRHVPVIMISGVEDTASIVRCIEAGAEDFLPKPFDPVILRARIGSGLNRKRLGDLEQTRVRDVFTRFLPEPIASEILARSGGMPTIGAVRLWATVMFIDLRGFTTFAESRGGLVSGDAAEVRRAAHTLKSNAATFGAQALSDRSRELEEAAKRDELTDGAAKLDAMARELEVVLTALPRLWQEMSAASS